MPKMIHKQKNPFGGEVYLDENFNVVGYGQKDSLGREVFLDKDYRYVGTKQKDLFGGEVYIDHEGKVKGHSRKGPSGNTIYTDRDYSYMGRSGGAGKREYILMDGKGSGREDSGRGKTRLALGLILFAVLAGIVFVMWMLMR